MNPRREKLFLTGMITAFTAVIFAIAWNKYANFGYNGFDLAIYNQTFWNTIHGHWFANSIHPPSYLGDHAEWLILALAPFYALVPHPLTLVFLQTAAIALSVIPIWLIAKMKFTDPKIRLLFPLLWITNAIVWNLPLFEFHMIVFAIPAIFLAAYFFLKKRWLPYIAMIALILLTREDMAFVVFGFALVAAIDLFRHRLARNDVVLWVLIPAALSILAFFIDQLMIGRFNPDGAYKFMIYYQWLGDTPMDVAASAIVHPVKVFLHLLKPNNLGMAFAFLLPVFFLPFARPRFLLLTAIVALEFMLTADGSAGLIIKTQYSAAFLPAIMLAAIEGYDRLSKSEKPFKFFPKPLLPVVVVIASVFTWFALGPGLGLLGALMTPNAQALTLKRAAAVIPADAPVVSSMNMLTTFSSRPLVWPMSYVWIGKKQFGTSDYILPVEPEYLVLDQQDFVYFSMVHPYVDWAAKAYRGGGARLRALIGDHSYGIIFNEKGIAVLKKGVGGPWPFVARYDAKPAIANAASNKIGPLNFLGWKQAGADLHLFFSTDQKLDKEYLLRLNKKYFPLGNGIYPTTDWQPGETVEVTLPINESRYDFNLTAVSGGLGLDGVLGLFLAADKDEAASETVTIP